ncbi:Fc.00g011370.m01.CDS01 [Cosmosporella sp. VM-42]
MDQGVLQPETNQIETNRRDTLDQAKIEILSRQRPEVLPNWIVEIGFVTAVVGSMMMAEYTISGFNIALPALAETLHIPESARTWPAAVPNLTTAIFLLPFSRLSERFGGRIVFLGGHIWLIIWSLVCGFSKNSTMLIVCRAMQGIGSSAFLPASLALMGQTYRPGPRKNLVFSLYGAFACIGFFFGIFIGGLASEVLGWKWYFFIGSIFGLFVTTVGLLTIPKSLGDSDASVKMDWPGVCTIVPGLALVVYALTDGGHAPDGWRTPYIYVTFIIGVLLLCGAIYVQGWYSAQPFLPAELFRPKYMKRLVASLFCCYGVFGLFMFYASFYIESVMKATPLQTAAWFAPLAGGGLVLALTGGFVLHLIPGRILLIISGLGFLASVLLFALIPLEGSTSFLYWAFIFPAMCCSTIGVDIAFNVTNVFITTSMPRRLQAVAGALINSLLYLGMAFWLGVGELAVTARLDARGRDNVTLRQQYQIGFWTAVGLSAASLALIVSVKMGQAAAEMTADEKAEMELYEMMGLPIEEDGKE